jgi:hypothetical protein
MIAMTLNFTPLDSLEAAQSSLISCAAKGEVLKCRAASLESGTFPLERNLELLVVLALPLWQQIKRASWAVEFCFG